jgi:hypothetical protein
LTPHLQATIKREAIAAWKLESEPLELEVAQTADMFIETYAPHSGALVSCFRAMAEIDRRVHALNARKPTGVNPLRFVEAVARNLPSINGKPFVQQVVLPALAFFEIAVAPVIWPPTPPNPYLAYALATEAGLRSAPAAKSDLERADESARHIEHGTAMEAESERLRSEHQARTNENNAEARRVAAG